MKRIGQAEFYRRAEGFIDRLMKEAPVVATEMGDHRFDDRLADYSKAALERQRREIKGAVEEFASFDTTNFDIDAKIDQRLVLQVSKLILRDLEKIMSHLRNPGTYSDECMGGVFLLLIKEFAPLEERLEKALGRLRSIPDVLAQGKDNIRPQEVPPVWNEVALESSQQGLALFTVLIPALAQQVPKLATDLNAASQVAARAFEDYARFLKEVVAPKAQGDFAAGKELFEELVRENHMLDYSADELLKTGWRLFEETDKAMADLAHQIDPRKTARELLEIAKGDHPKADELLDVYRREMARAKQFVATRNIVTIPERESLKIEPTPPFMRGTIPYAAYMMPGPLEKMQQGIFLVTPAIPRAPRSSRKRNSRDITMANSQSPPYTKLIPGITSSLSMPTRLAHSRGNWDPLFQLCS